jgi:hypothetical protein
MASKNTDSEHDEFNVLRELYDEPLGSGKSTPGFSVRKRFPVIKSYPGGPTYHQLKWALETIKCWKEGRALPTEESYIVKRGIYRHGRQNDVKGSARAHGVDEQRNTDLRNPTTPPPPQPEAGTPAETVDHLPQVQAGRGDDEKGGSRKKRPRNLRPR